MNEERDLVSENIGALCALVTELTAAAARERQALAALETRMQAEFKAVLDGVFILMHQGQPQHRPRTWQQHARAALGIIGWVIFGMVLAVGCAGVAMQYLVTQ